MPSETSTEKPPKAVPLQDERWALAKRVAQSATFSRSDRLSKLLLYVCKMHLAGREEEINEQRIGIDVFRRTPSFDSGSDSIVRSHATRLRQRLELYFEDEGRTETLRVEIPRGGYIPRFYLREMPVATEAPPLSTEPPKITPSVPSMDSAEQPIPVSVTPTAPLRVVPALLLGFTSALIAVALLLWLGHPTALLNWLRSREQTNAERHFWNSLLANGDRTAVVTGDSGLVLYDTFGKHEVALPDYIAGAYRRSNETSTSLSSVLDKDLPNRRYTSVADLNLAVRLSHLPQWEEPRTQVVFARDLKASDAAQSNLILIGSRVANPWVSLVDDSMNFVLTPDSDGRFYFLNRHPQQGERAAYFPSQPGSGTTDSSVYALVCYRPETQGMKKILLLSGLWQSGTEAAGNYVLGDRQFAAFLSKISRKDGSVPGFELLVQVHSVAGNAFASSIVASRIQ